MKRKNPTQHMDQASRSVLLKYVARYHFVVRIQGLEQDLNACLSFVSTMLDISY